MWMAIGIIGVLGFLVAIIGTLVMVVKRNPLWKKWLATTCFCFILFIVGAINDSSSGTIQSSGVDTPPITQVSESTTHQTNVSVTADQVVTPPPAEVTKINDSIQESKPASQGQIVYITNSGKKYHDAGCRYLKSQTAINLIDAKAQGYTPCGVCDPPN